MNEKIAVLDPRRVLGAREKIRMLVGIVAMPPSLIAAMCGLIGAMVSAVVMAAHVPSARQPESAAGSVVLQGVTVIDVRDGRLDRDMSIWIQGGKIRKIAPTATLGPTGAARTIVARGKYVVPGLLDMHTHPLDAADLDGSLTLMLTNGVTGVRQMAGSPELLARRKEGKLLLPVPAPEILAIPGTILTHANADSTDQVRTEVDRQKSQGADFIKTIDVAPDVFFAALAEAKRQHLPYVGHLSPGVDAVKASREGMRSIEHLGPNETLLISCSTDEQAIRAEIALHPPSVLHLSDVPMKEVETLLANPVLMIATMDSAYLPRIRHVVDTYDESKCRNVARIFIANHTWQVPTLITLRKMDYGDDPQYSQDPNFRYQRRDARELREAESQRFASAISKEGKETLRRLFALQLKVVKLFDQLGVPMLAGSDVEDGFGLSEEFDLLAQAGLSPLKVLQMTTINGAKFLHREADLGALGEGKSANLVLLDANPVESIGNLHRINAVVRGGIYYSGQNLAEMREKLEQQMKSESHAPSASGS